MPDFASYRLASTSWVLFPIDETMPIPVMTTRLMIASSLPCHVFRCGRQSATVLIRPARASGSRMHRGARSDPEILRAVDNLAVSGKPPVGNAERELRAHHALDVDVVHNLADVRQHLAEQLQFAYSQRPARPLGTAPDQEEPDHLPERVEAETAGHHRIALEMATEEPEVRIDIQFGAHQALAVRPADCRNLGDAVKHQHQIGRAHV